MAMKPEFLEILARAGRQLLLISACLTVTVWR